MAMTIYPASVGAAGIHSPALVRGRRALTLTLAGACYTSQWLGCSRLMLEWPMTSALKWFNVEDLTAHSSLYYVLCVRSKGARYKFWQDVGEVMPCELYDGQTLYSDAVFELWSTDNTVTDTLANLSFLLPAVQYGCDYILNNIEIAAVVPGRCQFSVTPVHNVGPAPRPLIQFAITTSLCPP